jgi:hypothetical protein
MGINAQRQIADSAFTDAEGSAFGPTIFYPETLTGRGLLTVAPRFL